MTDLIQIGLLIATIVGLILGFRATKRELAATRRIAKGEFLLHLDEMFREHKEVHRNLRPAGKWGENKGHPKSPDEWADVEAYMGLFERIKVLIDDDIIDLSTFDHLYGYRVWNIDGNDTIHREKLEGETADEWKDFIALRDALAEL